MTAATDRSGLLAVLRSELAPRPGRVAQVARIAVNCTLVVIIGMIFQVPLTPYMAYAVLLVSREEAASTLLFGMVAVLAFTIAVGLSLLFYCLDAAEPALRLPLMALSTFIGMYLVRVMALGPVAFLASFVLVLSQTLIDEIPDLEALTHFVLWLWPVVTIPVVVTVLVNLVIGDHPTRLARQSALKLLHALAEALRSGDCAPLAVLQDEAVALIEIRHKAGVLDHDLRGRETIDSMLIETLAELIALCRLLPAATPAEARLPLAIAAEACATSLAGGRSPAPLAPAESDSDPIIAALWTAMIRLQDGLSRRKTEKTLNAAARKSVLAPDAFTNPGHARFALKVTIAAMTCYVAYSLVDWPGISTSITTCFFVALGSLGETMHKLTLRLSGALLGGLLGGVCVVFVLPGMTDIGQLSLLILAVSGLGAWVSTSSDRIAYGGLQFAFAFFLTVMQGYGPSTDLTVPRDRVAGILLGNVMMSLVFSTLWPVSAGQRARASVAAALRAMAKLLEAGTPGTRLAVIRALGDAHRFTAIALFELGLLPGRAAPKEAVLPWESLDRLAASAFVVADQTAAPAAAEADRAAARWLTANAERIAGAAPALPSPPRADDIDRLLEEAAPGERTPLKARKLFLLLLPLLASACATDRLDLAPPRPDRPLAIPADFSTLPAPGSAPQHTAEEPETPPVAVDPALRYDLPTLIDLAQRTNPDTRVAWEKARQAALAVGLNETAYLPQISAEVIGGLQHTPLPVPASLIPKGYFTSDSRELIPSLTAKWLLFDFGQHEGAIDEAKANSFVANVAFTGVHEKLIYQVSRDYFALGAARGRLKVAKKALENALVVQDATEKKRNNGLATVVALHQAERETAQARFNLERSLGAERAAYTALMVDLGLPPSTQLQTADSSDLPLPPMPSGDVEQLIRDALASRPDMLAAWGKIRAAEASERGAKASYYPTVGLDTMVYENAGQLSSQGGPYSSVNLPGSSVLFKISVPLYDGGARDAKLALARSELNAAHSDLDRTRDAASKQVIDAYDAIKTGFAEYQAAVTLDVAAQTAYDSALEAYRHGVGTYTDLINAETSLAHAQSDREDAHANVFTAAAALAFATGSLARE